jgi:hypothetical protein
LLPTPQAHDRRDRVVLRRITRGSAGFQTVVLDGPHMLIETRLDAVAAAIEALARLCNAATSADVTAI